MGDNKLSDEMLAGGGEGGERKERGGQGVMEYRNITSYRKKSNTRLVC